jgi:hypothetical protein
MIIGVRVHESSMHAKAAAKLTATAGLLCGISLLETEWETMISSMMI